MLHPFIFRIPNLMANKNNSVFCFLQCTDFSVSVKRLKCREVLEKIGELHSGQ
jgi:hypothetical protein